jgi:hypothetical protein
MDVKFGYGPNGRALKKDGTERKARRTLSPEEKIAQLAEMEKKAFSGIGRKVLSGSEDLAGFNSGLDIFKGWVREARTVADAEKREARRTYLQSQIDALDSKGAIAEDFLPGASDAIDAVNGLYSRIGKGYQTLVKSGNATPENVSAMIRENISDDVRDIVESANDPENDPFRDSRKDSESESSEDDDTL